MSEAMTPERLAIVRELVARFHPDEVIFAVADVEALLAEVDRLQAQDAAHDEQDAKIAAMVKDVNA